MPYMTQTWRTRLGISGDDWAKGMAAAQFTLPLDYLYINPAGAYRDDAARPGMPPATDPEFVGRQLLDQHRLYRAVLLSGQCLGIGSLPDGMVAATIASAYNEWMTERWLQFDKRFRGALVVGSAGSRGGGGRDRPGRQPGRDRRGVHAPWRDPHGRETLLADL